MNPKDYAQILLEVLEGKWEKQQNEICARFKTLLMRNKDTHLRTYIEKELEKFQEQKGRANITYISSGASLSGAQRKELENLFPEPLEFSENPSLLGGVAVRKKDMLYNATLRKRIESLRSLL